MHPNKITHCFQTLLLFCFNNTKYFSTKCRTKYRERKSYSLAQNSSSYYCLMTSPDKDTLQCKHFLWTLVLGCRWLVFPHVCMHMHFWYYLCYFCLPCLLPNHFEVSCCILLLRKIDINETDITDTYGVVYDLFDPSLIFLDACFLTIYIHALKSFCSRRKAYFCTQLQSGLAQKWTVPEHSSQAPG